MSLHEPVPRTSGLAIASIILSCLSLVTLGVTAIPGVICGHMSMAGELIGRPSLRASSWILSPPRPGRAKSRHAAIHMNVKAVTAFFRESNRKGSC